MDDFMKSYRSEFYLEVTEILEKANADMLKAEQNPEDTSIHNAVFRGIHTVKGGAGMFEMPDVASFTHELEGILNIIRDGAISLNSALVDVILEGIDHINLMIKDYASDRPAQINDALVEKFKAIVNDPLSIMDITKATKEAIPETITTPIEAEKEQTGKDAEIGAQTMRIDESKLEQFTNVVGELLIARNSYDYLLNQIQHGEKKLDEGLKLLKDNLYQLSGLTNEIHHGVMSLRMVAVRGLFSKFNRIVRDISRRQQKPIAMITEGNDIEIDKKIADLLFDPMVHLVRNSCDHGIESPAARVKNGKPEQGKVCLKASQEGSMLIIRIIDDGKGMDRQKLFNKGIKAGLDLKSPEDDAVLDVIFLPGMSTKEKVTDISGRGVGMDVVKTAIQELGGNIQVKSEDDKGSEIILSIPMRMGINETLIVESGGDPYAIPIDFIAETMKIPPTSIRSAGSQHIFYYRGEVVPVMWLNKILNGGKDFAKNLDNQGEIALVILETHDHKYGLVVDQLNRNMEVAIKPLPDNLDSIDVVSGVSIMGDGKVFLVLNPDKFVVA
ncbi:chemotaxis protein CheA [Candidatus Magnetomorum sp. HK-1]|nr:chemotaxis protein CheA [Candidatus Magnetomorum sp. HK-1]